jgi:hypothetical protein
MYLRPKPQKFDLTKDTLEDNSPFETRNGIHGFHKRFVVRGPVYVAPYQSGIFPDTRRRLYWADESND